jgi:predicted Zn-dependent peptidase
MRLKILSFLLFFLIVEVFSQVKPGKINFIEYDLPNGLHVILHEDHSTPIVAVDIWYHVGSKNEDPERTGFAHLFEHMMFQAPQMLKKPNIWLTFRKRVVLLTVQPIGIEQIIFKLSHQINLSLSCGLNPTG